MPVFQGDKGQDLVNKVSTFDEEYSDDRQLHENLHGANWYVMSGGDVPGHEISVGDNDYDQYSRMRASISPSEDESDEEWGHGEEGPHDWDVGNQFDRFGTDGESFQSGTSPTLEQAKKDAVAALYEHHKSGEGSYDPTFYASHQNWTPLESEDVTHYA